MASQNNTGRQFDKQHGVTVVATADLQANRFVAYDGGYPTTDGAAKDSQGVSESSAQIKDALTVVTRYSYLVEAAGPIAFGALVKPNVVPAPDGRAVAGAADDHCARALGSATQAGRLIEVEILQHVHA